MSLRFDATVDRRLVHKTAVENVFVTDTAAGGGTWLAAVQLPRLHLFHNDVAHPRHDLLLVAEAARQGIAAIAHRLLAVPLGAQFVITEMRIEARDDDALAVGQREMVVDLQIERERRRRDGTLRGFTGEARCLVAGKHAASFSGTVLFLPAETYEAAREPRCPGTGPADPGPADRGPADPGPRAHPASVGRRQPANVMISPVTPAGPDGHQALVAADGGHPVFFDHPHDHLPGMLLLEAARQLAVARAALVSERPAAAFRLVSCAASFAGFAELQPPARLVADGSAGQAGVRVRQREEEIAVLALELRDMTRS